MSDYYIPFEIQTEIIKRVHIVKSIIRFRSVSKTWMSLIDSSEFIAGYGTRKTQPHSLLLRYIDTYERSVKYLRVNSDTFTQQQDLTPYVPLHMCYLRVIGYSRGLLCLYAPCVKEAMRMGMLVLWNPSIRRSVGILGSGIFLHIFGFAVCPVTNEPIIVKISKPWKVEVFTLSSKKWTVIQCNKPRECESFSLHEGQVVIDSCIYRVACETIRVPNGSCIDQYVIVSFDLNAKEFKSIDLPYTITNPFTSHIRFIISKLKGSLAVISVPHAEIKVWKMEPNCSFTHLFTINTSLILGCITGIVGFRKNGELLIEGTRTFGDTVSALSVYDPCSKQITNLGMSGRGGSFFINSYKETLLLLDHSDSCEYPEIS